MTTDLDDVLDAVMFEEPEPSHAALVRWINRYPEHRDRLTSFFETWAFVKEFDPEPFSREVEERIAQRIYTFAMKLLARR